MKKKKMFLLAGLFHLVLAVLPLLACTGQRGNGTAFAEEPAQPYLPGRIPVSNEIFSPDTVNIPQLLDEIAELERAGVYKRGMGFAESSLRERSGDYAGAVLAAFKELARF